MPATSMATMLECLTVSCTSALPSTNFSIVCSSLSPRRSSAKLPQFRSLKNSPVSITRPVGSVSFPAKRFNVRGLSIVCEAQNTTVPVEDIDDSKWHSLVLGSECPVMVEFWAPWCGPCRMITPIIDELAEEYAGKLKCFKVNTDASPTIASQYGIRSIPTVIIFKNGEKKDTIIGAVPKTTLTASIEKFL